MRPPDKATCRKTGAVDPSHREAAARAKASGPGYWHNSMRSMVGISRVVDVTWVTRKNNPVYGPACSTQPKLRIPNGCSGPTLALHAPRTAEIPAPPAEGSDPFNVNWRPPAMSQAMRGSTAGPKLTKNGSDPLTAVGSTSAERCGLMGRDVIVRERTDPGLWLPAPARRHHLLHRPRRESGPGGPQRLRKNHPARNCSTA